MSEAEQSKETAANFTLSPREKDAFRMVFEGHPKVSLDDEKIVDQVLERAKKAGVPDPTLNGIVVHYLI